MSIRLGIYDFFAYTIPGTFYLLIVIYAGAIWGFFDNFIEICTSISLVSALFLLGAGYVTGMIIDPLAERWHRIFRPEKLAQQAFNDFSEFHPTMETKIQAQDRELLLAYLRKNEYDNVGEIERFNAYRIMLRNISLGLLILAIIHVVFYITLSPIVWNIILATIFLLVSILAAHQGTKFGRWYYFYIFTSVAAEALVAEDLFAWNQQPVESEHKANNEVANLPKTEDNATAKR